MAFQNAALSEVAQPPIKVYKIDRSKINNRIAIDYIKHRVRLVMAENAIVADLLRLLDKAILDIRRDLTTNKSIAFAEAANIAARSGFGNRLSRIKVLDLREAAPDPMLPAVARVAAEQITRRIDSKLQGPVSQLRGVLRQSLVRVGDAEQKVFSTLINKQVPKPVRDSLGGIAIGQDLPYTQLQQLVDEPLGGVTYGSRLQATYGRSLGRVKAALFQGLVNGEDNKKIAGRVEGVISANLRHNAATLARTEVHRVANTVQSEMYARNEDIIDQLQFVATLDDKTCILCGNLDGQLYDVGDEPQIPIHPNCRCLLIPVLKSWRALGIDADDIPDTARASMDGTVPARMTFSDFFDDQDENFQRAVLGQSRYELYKQGALEFDQFSTSTRIRPIKNLIRMAGGEDELDMTNIRTVKRVAVPALPAGSGEGGDILLPGQLELPAVPEALVLGLKQSFIPGAEHPLMGLKVSSGVQIESALSDVLVQRTYEFGKSESARTFTKEYKDSISWMFGKDKEAIAKRALMLVDNNVGVATWEGKIALHPIYIDALKPLFDENVLDTWLARNLRTPVPSNIGLRGKRLLYLQQGGNPAAPKALQVLMHESTHFVSRASGESVVYKKLAYRVVQEGLTDAISVAEYKETARRLFGFSSVEAQAIPNVTPYYSGWINSLQSLTNEMPTNVRKDWMYRLKYQIPLKDRLDKIVDWVSQGRVERGLGTLNKARHNVFVDRLERALEAVGREGPFHRVNLADALRTDVPVVTRFVGTTAQPPYVGLLGEAAKVGYSRTTGVTSTAFGALAQDLLAQFGGIIPGVKGKARVLARGSGYSGPIDVVLGQYGIELKAFHSDRSRFETRMGAGAIKRKMDYVKKHKLKPATVMFIWNDKTREYKVYFRRGFGNFPVKTFGAPVLVGYKP